MTDPTPADPKQLQRLARTASGQLPRIRQRGDSVLLRARLRRLRAEEYGWLLVSPCCGKGTVVSRWVTDRMADGRIPTDQHMECGKPWWHVRGNPRRGGCRARYRVRIARVDSAGLPAVFELTWVGWPTTD